MWKPLPWARPGPVWKAQRLTTFDCMVLDLTLPDAAGYSLLETLSRRMPYSFPPVIVIQAASSRHDEEQKLRRYSKSIIIRARSRWSACWMK